MSELPLDPPQYPYYRWEYAILRLHADRAEDAAVHRLMCRLRRSVARLRRQIG